MDSAACASTRSVALAGKGGRILIEVALADVVALGRALLA